MLCEKRFSRATQYMVEFLLLEHNVLYTWWFILKMCYMFCGELRITNRVQVNDKLKQLVERKRERTQVDSKR